MVPGLVCLTGRKTPPQAVPIINRPSSGLVALPWPIPNPLTAMKHILVVGGGSIGERHARCLLNTSRAEVSLCDTSPDVRQRMQADYPLRHVFTSIEDAWKSHDGDPFDGVAICTPAHLHLTLAEQAVKRQVGVLIEKPLDVSLDRVDAFARLVAAQSAPIGVAYVSRHHPALRSMRTALHAGRFGAPVQLTLQSGQHFPFYRPAYREIYYTDRATGGGAIQDALTHMLNATEWLVGPINRLVADAEHLLLDGVEVEDTVHVIARHQREDRGEVMGSFALNQHQFANETTLTIACERAVVRYEAHRCRWLSCTEPNTSWQEEESWTLERDDLFTLQAEAMLEMLDGAPPACSLEAGIQTLRVNLAAFESMQIGEWVRP